MIGPPAAGHVELVSVNGQENVRIMFQTEIKIMHVRQLYSNEKLVILKSALFIRNGQSGHRAPSHVEAGIKREPGFAYSRFAKLSPIFARVGLLQKMS